MNEFKKFKRSAVAEMRVVTESDIREFKAINIIRFGVYDPNTYGKFDGEGKVSISDEDLKAGSPKIGDMIARNPKNHYDQWLVAEQYFKDNFEPIE